ncbi:MAG: phosphoribosyltransferase family protein [bacterium]|nr:phosphoribosyltransferase family protein [bacterium]
MRILKMILDCIMPPYEGVRELESMTPKGLIEAIALDKESAKPRSLPVDGLVVAFPYRARLAKAAIVEIKTNMNRRVVRTLAEATYIKVCEHLARFAASSPDGSLPILAPMPMTKKRRRERGWNQCELICRELDQIDGKNTGGRTFIYIENALCRTRETEDQVGMDKTERAANMKGSFGASMSADKKGCEIVRGRDVIILDDVATTGATLREAERAALSGGARNVLLVSIGY